MLTIANKKINVNKVTQIFIASKESNRINKYKKIEIIQVEVIIIFSLVVLLIFRNFLKELFFI